MHPLFFENRRQSPFFRSGLVGRFGKTKNVPIFSEAPFSGAGDAEFFDFGEEVGDDVVGVGGVEEAGGGEVGCQEVKQRPEVLRAGVDGGELH